MSSPRLTFCWSNAVFPSQCLVSIVAESRNKLMFGWVKLNICVSCQQYQVVATETVNPVALEANIDCAIATEKLDGTCCYVTMFEGNLLLFFFFLVIKFFQKHCNQQAKYLPFLNFLNFALLQFLERVCVFLFRTSSPLGSTRQETQQTGREKVQKVSAFSQKLQRYSVIGPKSSLKKD